MLKLVPRARFFDLFEKQSALTIKGAAQLHELIYNFHDARAKASAIKEIEHEADLLTHEIIQNLNMNFITPLDREDIYALAVRLDDVLDFIEACSERFVIYRIMEPDSACRAFADLVVSIVARMNEAVHTLRREHEAFHAHAIEVNRLENVADALLRDSLVALFEEASDPIEVLKWKEIYETLEVVTDRCEDVVNVIEGILIKAA
jgi:predicted phosphate transport protein (TIGR00153 family)